MPLDVVAADNCPTISSTHECNRESNGELMPAVYNLFKAHESQALTEMLHAQRHVPLTLEGVEKEQRNEILGNSLSARPLPAPPPSHALGRWRSPPLPQPTPGHRAHRADIAWRLPSRPPPVLSAAGTTWY